MNAMIKGNNGVIVIIFKNNKERNVRIMIKNKGKIRWYVNVCTERKKV